MSQGRYDDEHLYVEKYRNGGGGGGTAASTSYDDSQTHLNAENVQTAIEALNTKIGTNTSNIETLNANKQDKLTVGAGITISSDNVISSTGTGVVAVYNETNENLMFN